MRRILAAAVFVVALLAQRSARGEVASESPSYRLEPVSLSAAGKPVTSTSYRQLGTLGQAATVGTSSAPHFIVQSGYWGWVGTGLVPVVLSASRTPAAPQSVDLSWSGNDAPYTVYRAASCAVVYESVYTTTSNNDYTDAAAPTSGLTCYSVLALAPGPAPPPASAP